jgi:Arc/MetJ family transcription regulator
MDTQTTIDEQLMAAALEATGLQTEKEVIELGLQTLILLKKQEEITQYKGKLKWEGNLDEITRDY